MGVINETLTLTDGFSSSFRTFNDLGAQAVRTTQMLDKSLTNAMGKSAGAIIGNMRQLGTQLAEQNQQLIEAINNQKKWKEETDRTNQSHMNLLSTIKTAAAALGAVTLTKAFLGYADTQTQIISRLNLINDGLQTTDQLNEMIYQSAQRSRASYASTADAIAKMGLNAGNAFSSNQELIAFMETVNKQFAIGGSSAASMEGAMIQLTQAMGAGVLRGEELNSILDAAPGIARNIEQYMGWASGSIKQYAEQGLVSAEIVKNAMLASSDSINQQFESMPMTLSQAMNMMRNEVQHSLQDAASEWNDFINSADGQRLLRQMINLFSTLADVGVDALGFIGEKALWVVDNLDFILPILAAIGVAYGVLKAQAIITAAAQVGGALAAAAAWALANWPILLLIAVLAGALIAAQQFGIGMQEVGAWVGMVFGMIYAVGYNVFATLWNVIAAFAEFFANVWNDPLGATVRLFASVFDSILGMIETVAGAIDALLGSNLSGAVSGFRNKISGWVDDTFGENAVQIKRMAELDVYDTSQQWGQYGSNLGSKLDNLNLNIEDLAGGLGNLSGFSNIGVGGDLGDIGKVGSVGSVKNVEGDVNLSDEDLKLYRDLAERRYMNQIELKTLAPNIAVTLPAGAGKNLTADDVANKIKTMLIQQMASNTAVSH